MKAIYQCKVCFQTFSLLRYLRKHISIPTEGGEPNKCVEFYRQKIQGNNFYENFRVVGKISPTDALRQKNRKQHQRCLNSENLQLSNDDEISGSKEQEHVLMKFEPDEGDKVYFVNETPIVSGINNKYIFLQSVDSKEAWTINTNGKIVPEISLDSNDKNILRQYGESKNTRKEHTCTTTVVDKDRSEILKNSVPTSMLNVENPETTSQSSDVNPLGPNRTERILKCKICKFPCASLEHLCRHYETLHKLPVVSLERLDVNNSNFNPKQTRNRKENQTTSCSGHTVYDKHKNHYRSKVCGRQVSPRLNLKKHKKVVHKRPVKCDICQKQFRSFRNLMRHKLSVHDGVRYRCDICAKQFSQPAYLKEHQRSSHDGVSHKCNICQKQFAHSQHLKRHKLSVHDGVKYTCDICEKQFAYVTHLKEHKLSVHDGVKHTCDICQKQFAHVQYLKEHKLRVHDRVKHTCNICQKQYAQKQSLKQHKLAAHEGQYICNICLNQFSSKRALQNHKLGIHEGQESKIPQLFYKCDICQKQVESITYYKKYMHDDEGSSYVCINCSKNYIYRNGKI